MALNSFYYTNNVIKSIKKVFPCFGYSEITRRNISCLRLDCKAAAFDLQSNGVLLRKSTENRNNLRFPKISPNLYSHFIRGFFEICFIFSLFNI